MENIKSEVLNCRKCELWKTRKNPVVGEGSLKARIMFIGEAPGFNEDLQGRPFVGKAGKVLNELIESIGLRREDVYITNVVKCRPPENRDPTPEEIEKCSPYIDRQIKIIRPEIICTLGKHSTSYIFKKFGLPHDNISRIHGKIYRVKNLFYDLLVIPLYHPAVAVYNADMKSELVEDFKIVKEEYMRLGGLDENSNTNRREKWIR